MIRLRVVNTRVSKLMVLDYCVIYCEHAAQFQSRCVLAFRFGQSWNIVEIPDDTKNRTIIRLYELTNRETENPREES